MKGQFSAGNHSIPHPPSRHLRLAPRHKIIARFLTFIAFLFMGLHAHGESELALPSSQRTVPLATTIEANLGTLPDGVGVQPGTQLPALVINDHLGQATNLKDLAAKQPLLIVFYRGGWCPYCNLQIRQMTENYASFEERNVLPVFISVDKPDAAALALKTYDVPFPVLSDPALVAHKAFNVVMEQNADTVARYQQYGIDLASWSGESHGSIAISSVFIVDQSNTVRWAHAAMDYKTRPSVAQLLKVIDQK